VSRLCRWRRLRWFRQALAVARLQRFRDRYSVTVVFCDDGTLECEMKIPDNLPPEEEHVLKARFAYLCSEVHKADGGSGLTFTKRQS
jgi:hypothetical protein